MDLSDVVVVIILMLLVTCDVKVILRSVTYEMDTGVAGNKVREGHFACVCFSHGHYGVTWEMKLALVRSYNLSLHCCVADQI
jgi:hypothetical protein